MEIIRLERVDKAYGARRVLSGLSFTIDEGTVYALVGGDGAGKSTTARLVVGLTAASSGRLSVYGSDPWLSKPAFCGRLGHALNERPPYPWITVDETLRFHASLYPTWDELVAADLLSRFEVERGSRTGELSAAGLAALALACGTAFHPAALVLDEPTRGLDAGPRRAYLAEVERLAHEESIAVLLTARDVAEVAPVADRIGVLSAGRIACELSREEALGGGAAVVERAHLLRPMPLSCEPAR
jgi:ABC-2 type transport system ATP-binding protein